MKMRENLLEKARTSVTSVIRKGIGIDRDEFAKKMVQASMGDVRHDRYDYEVHEDGSVTIKMKHYISECTPIGDGKRFRFKGWFLPENKNKSKVLSISRIMRV